MTRLLAAALLCAACTDPVPSEPRGPGEMMAPEEGVLRMGGSGAMGPMMRALAAAYANDPRNTPKLKLVVEDSIGTGGGVRAVTYGAIDLAMISRPLSSDEQALGLAVVHVGTDAVVIAANRELPVDEISSELLRELYSGARRSLPDGTPVTVLLRDTSESAHLALDAAIPGMHEARLRAYGHGFRVLYHDDAMAPALFETRNAIGLDSLALLQEAQLHLKALRIDGRTPSVNGGWPMTRDLYVAARPDRLDRVGPFVDFARSEAGRAIIAKAGYGVPK